MTDQNPSAGATPVAGGATPLQNTPAQPVASSSAVPSTPATGDSEGLGDAGKRALTAERERAKAAEARATAAEKERDELRAAGQTESEKRIAEARKEGASEAAAKLDARVLRAEVRAALTAAGINAGVLDLATRADEFTVLKVNDAGDVEGLTAAVEAFKSSTPDLFRPTARPTGFDGGPRGNSSEPFDMNKRIRRAAGRA